MSGSRIFGTTGAAGIYSGALTTLAQNTRVLGNVTFDDNRGLGDAGGAIAVGLNASLIFEDETIFTNNSLGTMRPPILAVQLIFGVVAVR